MNTDISAEIESIIGSVSADRKMLMLGSLLDTMISEYESVKQELTGISNIPVDSIDPHFDHPYYVVNDDDMANLVRSLKAIGQITPGAVRIKDNGRYELLSGHRRLWACRLAGIRTFRCEVLDLTDEDALIYMIEANRQRSGLHPGEKGKIYKMKRNMLEDRPEISDIKIDAHDSPDVIRSYMRLDDLIPEIMELVDEGSMSLRPASTLSFLSKTMQRFVYESMEYEQSMPTHAQTIRMKKLFEERVLSKDKIEDIMMEKKPNQRDRVILHDEKLLAKLPKGNTAKELEEYIDKALDFYMMHRRK